MEILKEFISKLGKRLSAEVTLHHDPPSAHGVIMPNGGTPYMIYLNGERTGVYVSPESLALTEVEVEMDDLVNIVVEHLEENR